MCAEDSTQCQTHLALRTRLASIPGSCPIEHHLESDKRPVRESQDYPKSLY